MLLADSLNGFWARCRQMLLQPDCPGNKAAIRKLMSFEQTILELSSVCFEGFIYWPCICLKAALVLLDKATATPVSDGGSSISTSLVASFLAIEACWNTIEATIQTMKFHCIQTSKVFGCTLKKKKKNPALLLLISSSFEVCWNQSENSTENNRLIKCHLVPRAFMKLINKHTNLLVKHGAFFSVWVRKWGNFVMEMNAGAKHLQRCARPRPWSLFPEIKP